MPVQSTTIGTNADLSQEVAKYVPAAVIDEDGDILEANAAFAHTLNTDTPEELVGESLVGKIMMLPTWVGANWTGPLQQVTLLKTYMDAAKEYGRSGAEVNYMTPNHMLYRGSINLVWREDSKTFLVWKNINDVLTQKEPHGVGQVWASEDSIHQDYAGAIRQQDIQLMYDYCNSNSVAELAEQYGLTKKSMEHKLRLMAEGQGFGGITDFAKYMAKKFLRRFAGPHNTLSIFKNLPAHDTIRKRILPQHKLPPAIQHEMNQPETDPSVLAWLEKVGNK